MYWVCIMCLVLEWKIIKQAFFWLWRVDPEKIHLMCMPKRNLSAKMDSPWPTKSPNFMSNRLAEAFLRNLYTGKNLWLKSWLPALCLCLLHCSTFCSNNWFVVFFNYCQKLILVYKRLQVNETPTTSRTSLWITCT